MDQKILDEGYRNLSAEDEATLLRLEKENTQLQKRITSGRGALLALPVFTVGIILFFYQENFFRVLWRGIPLFSQITNLILIGLFGYSYRNPRIAFLISIILYVLIFFFTLAKNGFYIPVMVVICSSSYLSHGAFSHKKKLIKII
ncbi:MAG: hypothetical protein AAF573_03685 [Bacteroidota bacterium]